MIVRGESHPLRAQTAWPDRYHEFRTASVSYQASLTQFLPWSCWSSHNKQADPYSWPFPVSIFSIPSISEKIPTMLVVAAMVSSWTMFEVEVEVELEVEFVVENRVRTSHNDHMSFHPHLFVDNKEGCCDDDIPYCIQVVHTLPSCSDDTNAYVSD